ncbi:hypothetical protein GLYMA_12G137901v4 [Glycine max]|nr:hypothetical protein GLYMA_12G137901v4 [Glycine max]KAH1143061.1 hypothetical protein GYH30_033661 [Glycine max]
MYNIQLFDEPRDDELSEKLCIGEAPTQSQSTSSILKRLFSRPLHLVYAKAHKDSVSHLLFSLPIFSCMRELDLSFCNLHKIPGAFGNLHCLECLDLMGNNFSTLPCLKELSKLLALNLQHCKRLKYLPELPSRTYFPSRTYMPPWSIRENLLDDDTKFGLYIFNCPELIEGTLHWHRFIMDDTNCLGIPPKQTCMLSDSYRH